MNCLKILTITSLYLTLSISITRAEDAPRVMVTIKPVHAIVSALLKGISQPELLLDGLNSPHTYHLKPSDVQRLNRADMIVWVGPSLEGRLRKIINQQRDQALIITLVDIPNEGQPPDKTQARHEKDPHLWLNPQLVIELTKHLRQSLISVMPKHSDKINRNTKKLISKLERLDKQIEDKFIGQKHVSAIVYHDAWKYFETRYGLTTDGTISTHEQQQPGASHLYTLQKKIKAGNTQCLLIGPQFKPRYLNILDAERKLKIITADPLGTSINAGPDAYFVLMRNIAKVFQQCLKN